MMTLSVQSRAFSPCRMSQIACHPGGVPAVSFHRIPGVPFCHKRRMTVHTRPEYAVEERQKIFTSKLFIYHFTCVLIDEVNLVQNGI
ncbi:hypothetical protein CBX60_23560 [Salmonella enterica subsp. enterica serovar Pensacola]|nr:hypothetical protein [Salmonella enterica]ECT8867518.1 hypothetical protein [Salmonella enterica subsp. enterica serovar Pensacola]